MAEGCEEEDVLSLSSGSSVAYSVVRFSSLYSKYYVRGGTLSNEYYEISSPLRLKRLKETRSPAQPQKEPRGLSPWLLLMLYYLNKITTVIVENSYCIVTHLCRLHCKIDTMPQQSFILFLNICDSKHCCWNTLL